MSVDTDDVKNVAAETAAGAEQNAVSVLNYPKKSGGESVCERISL